MKKITYVVAGVIGLAVLGFAYYAISPLFRHVRLDEAAPVSSRGASQGGEATGAPITGTTGHPASGSARIVESGGKRYLRYENLQTINGPDLYVYLAKDVDAKEYISLGVIRATEGNVNYDIPAEVDLSTYRYALTWCKQFSVLFNYADLGGTR